AQSHATPSARIVFKFCNPPTSTGRLGGGGVLFSGVLILFLVLALVPFSTLDFCDDDELPFKFWHKLRTCPIKLNNSSSSITLTTFKRSSIMAIAGPAYKYSPAYKCSSVEGLAGQRGNCTTTGQCP
uniref:Uncharacterized protein n=1 Tax=Romanomermis culicivorax TaxID=13658 RepID=A0A915JRM8_ROMCU